MNNWYPTFLLWQTNIQGGTCMVKKYDELTFTDDFMFCKVLEQNPKLCLELLELVLGHKVGPLVSINRQKPVEITPDGRGVRFDVYAEGSDQTIYEVEMQNAEVDSIARRSRYYQGMIDLNLIQRGAKYKDLSKTYIIYICRFNLFKEIGRHKYSFLRLCEEDPQIELGDGAATIFLCAEGTQNDVSPEMRAFLQYVANNIPTDTFTSELEREVKRGRDHLEWRLEYMTLQEHIDKAIEEERKRVIAAEERARIAEERVLLIEEELRKMKELLSELQQKNQT